MAKERWIFLISLASITTNFIEWVITGKQGREKGSEQPGATLGKRVNPYIAVYVLGGERVNNRAATIMLPHCRDLSISS